LESRSGLFISIIKYRDKLELNGCVKNGYTRAIRTGGSDHFILFLPHKTVSYVYPHNDSISRMETLRRPDFEIYFAHQ
jgi:hypothetical protein